MRNKLTYLLIAAAAIMASACTRTHADKPDNSIHFSPVAAKSTKAIISGTTYPTDESFVVSAYVNGTDSYFEDNLASYSNASSLWETSESQYWPLSGSLDFVAYSPSSAQGISVSANGISAEDYTIVSGGQMTTDLCYAGATVADCSNHPEYVQLTFSHALSQIVFRVKAADYYTNSSRQVTISLTSLAMAGIYSVGDFSDGIWGNQESENTYSLSATPTPLTYDANDDPETVDICSYVYIPQELGPNAELRVGYQVKYTYPAAEPDSLVNAPVSIPLGSNVTEWQAGKKYIYTISIGMDNLITFTASAVGWLDENDNIIVEEN